MADEERMECETTESETQEPVGKKMKPSDFAQYDSLVNQLAKRLKIARHPDSSIVISAASLLLDQLLTGSMSASSSPKPEPKPSQSSSPLLSSTSTPSSSVAVAASTTQTIADGYGRDNIQPTILSSDDTKISQVVQKAQTKSASSGTGFCGDTTGCKDSPGLMQKSKFIIADVTLPVSLSNKLVAIDGSNRVGGGVAKVHAGDVKDDLRVTFEHASKSLKLLYLYDQKQLQFLVNKTISSVQCLTANPKTDSKLISIGR